VSFCQVSFDILLSVILLKIKLRSIKLQNIYYFGDILLSMTVISPILYEQLFHTKVLCAPFMCLQFGFVIFWRKDFDAKAAHKMLVKMTHGCHFDECHSAESQSADFHPDECHRTKHHSAECHSAERNSTKR
jgi:hypothetical protein